MKKKVYKSNRLLLVLPLLLLLCIPLSAQNARKEISETYNVKKGFTFNVESKYSDIELLTWDRDVLDVVVIVEVDAGSRERSENILRNINIDIKETGNSVSYITNLDFPGSPGKGVKLDIKYTVKLPSYLNVTIENSYGNVYIQELAGLAKLDLQYGNLKINKLARGNVKPYNNIEIAYGNAGIEEAGWLELGISYSEFEASKFDMLIVESKYSKLYGENAGTVISEGKYDKYTFRELDNFVAELKYSNVKIDKLHQKFDLNASYTNVKIDYLLKGFEKIRANLSYGNFSAITEPGTSYNLNADSKYGEINVSPASNLSRSRENGNLKVSGTVGTNPKSDVNIVTRYGNIHIK